MDNDVLKEVSDFIISGLHDHIGSLIKYIDDNKPIKFYRKIRTRKGIKRRYMIRVNPYADYLLDSMSIMLPFARRVLFKHHEV